MAYLDCILRVGGVAFDIEGILDGELSVIGAIRHVELGGRNIKFSPEIFGRKYTTLCLPFSYDSSSGEIDVEARALWGERLKEGIINPQRHIDSRVVSYIADSIKDHFKIDLTQLKAVEWSPVVIHGSYISKNLRERAVELFRRGVKCYKIPRFSVPISGKDFDASFGVISAKEYRQMEREENKVGGRIAAPKNPVVLDRVGGYERWLHSDIEYRGGTRATKE